MIKIVFNFKYIYMYALMHTLHAVYIYIYNNLTNNLYFIIKIVFNFKCIHAFVWVTC